MNSLRRRVLLAGLAAASGVSSSVFAATKDVAVVKIMSIACPVCRAAESIDTAIRKEIQSRGGRFVWAPVPDTGAGYREALYFVARNYSDELGEKVKAALYSAAQDNGLTLDDLVNVETWLHNVREINSREINALLQGLRGNSAMESVRRAVTLAMNAGVTALPSYITLVSGEITAVNDPETVAQSSLTALRQSVLDSIQKAYQ